MKKSYIENGKVVSKNKTELESAPTTMCITENAIVLGDDDSSLTMLDQRTLKKGFQQTDIHEDCITSVISMGHKSKYQFLTSGSTTVALVDIRKGIIVKSDDQEDEILSGCLATEQTSTFGMSEGIVTVWKNDQLQDQRNRIRLSEESIDCMIASEFDNKVYAGGADGWVRLVNARSGRIENQWQHSSKDEVIMLELDHEYKLVSAGMESLCVWDMDDKDEQGDNESEGSESEESESEESESENESENKSKVENKSESESECESKTKSRSQSESQEMARGKYKNSNDSDNKRNNKDNNEQENEEPIKKRKKMRQGKQKQKNPPTKKHIHGIASFDDL